MVLPDEVPIRETNPLRPLSPYAVSKVAQDMLGYQYWMSWKLDSVRTRGFNHEGPRRGPVFVVDAQDRKYECRKLEAGKSFEIFFALRVAAHFQNREREQSRRQHVQCDREIAELCAPLRLCCQFRTLR